jgi:hypothetical protein
MNLPEMARGSLLLGKICGVIAYSKAAFLFWKTNASEMESQLAWLHN